MRFSNPYQGGPFLFKVAAFIIGLFILYDALELFVTGGRLFNTGLLSEGGLFGVSYYAQPEIIVLITVSFLYLIFGFMVMYRAYWVRFPLYFLFGVTYLDTLHKMIVELDLWGSILNITLLILISAYVVWHAKYVNDSFPWGLLQWLMIFFILLDFALGPLSLFMPFIPNINEMIGGVVGVGLSLWDWFYTTATTV